MAQILVVDDDAHIRDVVRFALEKAGHQVREAADGRALLWIGGGLVGLIACIALGGGFIIATAILFSCTARGFGREALLVDIAIGLALGTAIYLLFLKLLTLSLPTGPLEALLS